jgi:transcriptional regulator with XRE-family HTH domain
MAAPQSPIGSRRRLGAELRRLRNSAGLTLDDVAEQMTCSTSKISRLETGKGIPKIPDVRELMRIYGVASDTERDMLLRLVRDARERGWWESYTDGVQPARFVMDAPGRYAALENDAIAVRSFDLTIVNGLLQTEEYARTVIMAGLLHHTDEEIGRLVTLRMKRQDALVRTDPAALELLAVVDEAVLHRSVGRHGVMAEQMQRLLDLTELPNVSVRVLPFAAGMHRAHSGHFVILEIPRALGSDVVYIEGHAGEAYLDGESDVDMYKDVFADVLRYTLSADESREVVGRYLVKHAPRRKASPL